MTNKKPNKVYSVLRTIFSRVGKRKRFIICDFLVSLLFLISTFYSADAMIIFVPVIFLVVFFLTFIAILDDISQHELFTLFVHPIIFSLAFYFFYFFLPQRWLTRAPFLIIYAISMYAIMLSQNIFNVGVTKSLQLFRAAFSINYFFLTITAFISYSLIVSLRMNFLLNFAAVLLVTWPLSTHFLWTVEPKNQLEKATVLQGFFIAVLLGEMATVLSFIPVNQSIFALVLTSLFYSLSGLFQVYVQNVLFKERIREYLIVLAFVAVIFILSL